VFSGAESFNGNLSAWNVGSVVNMDHSACGPASAAPHYPRVLPCWGIHFSCSPRALPRGGGCKTIKLHPRKFTLRPQPPSAASGGGAGGRPASAGVRCPTVGLEPPTTRSCRSAATGVWLCGPSRRAWGVGRLRAVFLNAPGPCKCFHGPFNPRCDDCADACHPSGKACA
jgi:surface protein